jgi:hypothetical protein
MARKYTLDALQNLAVILGPLPERVQVAAVRAFSAACFCGEKLPPGFSEDIQAITIEGVDPEWQIEQLEAIVERRQRSGRCKSVPCSNQLSASLQGDFTRPN